MASLNVFRIEFLANNPYGSYVAGDVIDVLVDDTAVTVPAFLEDTGVSIELNGSPSALTTLISTSPSIVSIQNFNLTFCSATYLLEFSLITVGPYVAYTSQANHYSCAVNSPTCDLLIVGTPTVIPATDQETADGSITITATSTNTIEYNLNEDFAYGSGQSSSSFSGLLPGDYRIFLRDSKGCGINVLVTVNFDNTYGVLYRLEYYGLLGLHKKLDITKRGYSGAATDVKGTGEPVEISLRGEGVLDKFEPVLATEIKVGLISETLAAFEDLYTNDRNLYRADFYIDFGSGYEKQLTTKVLPFIYEEPLESPPYPNFFRSSDGLPELKDLYLFHPDGQKFQGTVSLIKLVAYCLSFLNTDLNIRVGINMYAEGMDTTDADDPFDQAYIDYECFYLEEETPTLDFIIRSILKPFRARIVQWNNVWNIMRIEELVGEYDYREFDADGDYVSNSSRDPVKSVDVPDNGLFVWEAFPNRELQSGYGKIRVNYKLGLKPNILTNGDFALKSVFVPFLNSNILDVNRDGFVLINAGYPLTESHEILEDGNVAYVISSGQDTTTDTSGGEAYIQSDTYSVAMGINNQLKINIRYKVPRTSFIGPTTTYQLEVRYVKVRLRVKYGSQYLQNDGTWTSDENILEFFVTTFNEYQESEIVASQPTSGTPASGMNFEVRLYHAYPFYTNFQSIAGLEGFITYDSGNEILPTGYKTELRDTFSFPSYIYYYELEENTDAASGYLIVRPDDYHVTNNPRQWIQKARVLVYGGLSFPFHVDRIQVSYLTNGNDSIDTIIRSTTAESLNREIIEEDLIIGSESSLIATEPGFELGFFTATTFTLTVVNALSADLIYTGWLRDSSGSGYANWTRDGVSESDKLHGIWLRQVASQYSRTWRLVRGTITSRINSGLYFSPIDTVKYVNDSNRKYLPISLTIFDKSNRVSGEFLELVGDTTGSDGSTGSPFTSGFSVGFGSGLN
jgi:hypothetical protein